jgi:hypothetical protein
VRSKRECGREAMEKCGRRSETERQHGTQKKWRLGQHWLFSLYMGLVWRRARRLFFWCCSCAHVGVPRTRAARRLFFFGVALARIWESRAQGTQHNSFCLCAHARGAAAARRLFFFGVALARMWESRAQGTQHNSFCLCAHARGAAATRRLFFFGVALARIWESRAQGTQHNSFCLCALDGVQYYNQPQSLMTDKRHYLDDDTWIITME